MQNTKEIKIGNIIIGGHYPIAIQSMTNTKTKDIKNTIAQINKLASIGCKIIRVAILDMEDAIAIKEIKKEISIPVIADIHFDYRLAIAAIKNGADKIRINPGNIGNFENLSKIIEVAKEYHIPIRIGVNSGSVESDLLKEFGGPTPMAMFTSMKRYVEFFEKNNFFDLVLSIKATNINTLIETNKLLKENFNYPIHIGLTEAGTITSGTIRSSYALGVLLENKIGDTIRVSLTGNPINEIPVAKEILAMHGYYHLPQLICCPTCGRTSYNMEHVVNEIECFLNNIECDLKIAIMGCVVNGPGEAREADLGIAGGNGVGVIFKKGQILKKVNEDLLVPELEKEIIAMIKAIKE